MKPATRSYRSLAVAVILGTIVMPGAALAENGADDTPTPTISASPTSHQEAGQLHAAEHTSKAASSGQNFCARFAANSTTQTKDFDQKVSKLDQDQLSDTSKRQAAEQQFDQKVTDARAKADDLRQQHFDKLDSEAVSDDQKAAVTQFQTTVSTAVTTRRAAVDQARDTFRTGVTAAVSARQTSIKAALAAFHTSVAAAITAAQASCTAGTNPQTVLQNFKAALQTAHTNLKTALQAAAKVGEQVKTLAAARNTAVSAANTTFKQTVQQAASTLKQSLGQTDSSPSPTP